MYNILDALFCAAKAKVFFPDQPLYLVTNGTDPLERIFGNIRCMHKNNNVDSLELIQCSSAMAHTDKLLLIDHQEWSKGRECQDAYVWITPVSKIGT